MHVSDASFKDNSGWTAFKLEYLTYGVSYVQVFIFLVIGI